jgi:anti-sigma factor RsiW
MNCHAVQTELSAYLYGELDFASEEALETHLADCAFCQLALAREKAWHTTLNSEYRDVPLDLLSTARQNLRSSLTGESAPKPARASWRNWVGTFGFSPTRWSLQVAAASFLVFVGFAGARLIDSNSLPGASEANGTLAASVLGSSSRVRDIQSNGPNGVRLIVEQIREQEVNGSVEDGAIRQLLLNASRESNDPGIRVDSVEILNSQNGSDVRDALLYSIRHDANAAVRLKALEGLSRFPADRNTRDALKFVLQHDANPGVRSAAIDLLAPSGRTGITPDLANTLVEIMRGSPDDDYVHARCFEVLRTLNTSLDAY